MSKEISFSIDSGRLNGTTEPVEETIGRLKEALGARSDGQLATCLGISRQNIGAARKRGDVPPGWIYKVAELTGCSMDWLGFGQGPKRTRQAYAGPPPDTPAQLASPQAAYGLRGDLNAKPADISDDHLTMAGFGEAVELLAKIYHSGDRTLIRAVNANIRALCEVMARK